MRFIDLFAGIGGFHEALGSRGMGMECVFASEIDPQAAAVYAANHGVVPHGDIKPLAEAAEDLIPSHDLLAAGFPCQPFSKSGFQRGLHETRGTLFFNICQVLEAHQPQFVVLENVRNLAGPRQRDTWDTVVRSLRDLGYRVSSTPAVFSPHLLPPERGGAPQVRERVFVLGERVGRRAAMADSDCPPLVVNRPVDGWDPRDWRLSEHLPLERSTDPRFDLSVDETALINCWNDFVQGLDDRLPGFPVWADALVENPVIPPGTPAWKQGFLVRNAELYRRNAAFLDEWLARADGIRTFAPSRRKLEWQAGEHVRDIWAHAMHLRPSGLRVKQANYLPALVAITQTSIIGPLRRRITPREAARLQGLPDEFLLHESDRLAYKQLGNGVNVGVVRHVVEALLDDAATRRLASAS